MHVRWNDIDDQRVVVKSKLTESTENQGTKSPDDSDRPQIRSDLYQALLPIYHLDKLFGLLPVRFVKMETGRYQGQLYTIDIFYSICLLVLLLGLECWGLWRDLRDGWEHSTRLKSRTTIIATSSDVFGIISLTSVAILGSSFRWKYLQQVMDKLVEVDEKIGIIAPKKTRRFTITVATLSLTYLIVASCLDVYCWDQETKASRKMEDKGPINYTPLYFMYIVIILMELQYGVVTYNVGQRFARLNKSLENILRAGSLTQHFHRDLGLASDLRDIGTVSSRQDPGLRMFRKKKVLDLYSSVNDNRSYAGVITELVTLHASLCDTVSYINSAYGVAILAITLTCLLHLIITPYFLILEADGNRGWIFLLTQVLWCILHVSRMLIIVQPTYSTVVEGKKTAIVVSQLLSSSPGEEARKQLEMFSMQLLHRPLEFSACGLFSLDRALVTSMAGAVTTYLVILIQFQKADDTKGDADVIRNVSMILKNASSFSNLTAFNRLP